MTFFDGIRRLGYRRGPDRIVGGICGGIAARTGWSVSTVRVVTAILILTPILGLGAYLVAWILTPWIDDSIPLERLFGTSGR